MVRAGAVPSLCRPGLSRHLVGRKALSPQGAQTVGGAPRSQGRATGGMSWGARFPVPHPGAWTRVPMLSELFLWAHGLAMGRSMVLGMKSDLGPPSQDLPGSAELVEGSHSCGPSHLPFGTVLGRA